MNPDPRCFTAVDYQITLKLLLLTYPLPTKNKFACSKYCCTRTTTTGRRNLRAIHICLECTPVAAQSGRIFCIKGLLRLLDTYAWKSQKIRWTLHQSIRLKPSRLYTFPSTAQLLWDHLPQSFWGKRSRVIFHTDSRGGNPGAGHAWRILNDSNLFYGPIFEIWKVADSSGPPLCREML